VHGRRREPGRCQPRVAGAAVPEPEPPLPRGVRKDRASADQVAEVLVPRGDAAAVLPVSRFRHALNQLPEPVPAVQREGTHVLLDLGGLQGEPLGEYERHPAPDRVRLDPLEVPVPAHLFLFRPLPVDADRAVLDDEPDLVVRGEVLEVHDGVVLAYLLDVAFDLLGAGDVPVHPEFPPDEVPDED